jgi:hypothetical protein
MPHKKTTGRGEMKTTRRGGGGMEEMKHMFRPHCQNAALNIADKIL